MFSLQRSLLPGRWLHVSGRQLNLASGAGLSLMLVAACGTSSRSNPPSSYPCHLREDAVVDQNDYERVGELCWNEHLEQREEVDRKACNMGGQVIVHEGGCTIGSGRGAISGFKYVVYLRREAAR